MAAALSSISPAHQRLQQAGLDVLVPSNHMYKLRQDSYFSKTASQLAPECIIRPRSTSEVSTAICILSKGKYPFAIRSGGHAPMSGANNIEGGVTIDLGRLNWTKLVCPQKAENQHEEGQDVRPMVDIGPGACWTDVYASLQPHDLVVAGGRDGGVGVGGLILGGGNTYFTAREGFSCDNVVAFEVVLAPDGCIVTATADNQYADLFWALKGGANNFGIVTNFRMQALKGGTSVWGGLSIIPWQHTCLAAKALTNFTSRIKEDCDSNLLCFFAHRVNIVKPESAQSEIVAVFAQVAGVEKAPAYEEWLALPSVHTDCRITPISEFVDLNTMPSGYYSIWFTATFKNDPRIVSRAALLHETLVNILKTTVSTDGDFWALCLFQPLPKIFSVQKCNSSNALGLSRPTQLADHDGLLLQTTVMVPTSMQEKLAYPHCKSFLSQLRDFASCEIEGDGNLDWEYINYADTSQDPLGSYGKENCERLKEVARKYDPEEVFQTLCKGGFKITRVEA